MVEVVRWAFVVIMLLAVLVSALYRRTGIMSGWRTGARQPGDGDFVELWRLAYATGLGGTAALRPFLRADAAELSASSPPAAYRDALETPEFVRLPWILAFCFCILVVGFSSFVLVGPVEKIAPDLSTMLFGGPEMHSRIDGSPAAKNFVPYQLNALNWMMTAFLGGYIWSIGYLLWRMGQRDVTGHAYNTISVRMLVAGLLAVVLFHIFRNWTGIEGYVLLLPLAAGLTPQWVMIWLLRWIQQKLQSADEKETDLSPKLIEGIDEMVRARLSEAGVDDAQGLASANPLRLAIQTPFTFSSVLDWTGQALLLVYAKPDKFRDLSERGVRTAYELVALPDDARNTIGTALGLDLGPIVGSLRVDPSYLRYAEIVRRMNALPGPA
ncbi:MAG: hypothetical protein U1E45_21645 [Geminicoccaceae bacterium]